MKKSMMQPDNYSITMQASMENLPKVKSFVNEKLDMTETPKKVRMNIHLSVEEIFTNICSYAYKTGVGDVTIEIELNDNKDTISITFVDTGIPYNPIEKPAPVVKGGAGTRKIGGLGIFITKKLMDNMSYEYINNENRLTIMKCLKPE